MIRDVSRGYLDGEPTTADEYNNNHLKIKLLVLLEKRTFLNANIY